MEAISNIKTSIYMEAQSLYNAQDAKFASDNFSCYVYDGLKRMQEAKCFTKDEIKEVKDYADKVSADFMKMALNKAEKRMRENFKF